MAVDRYTKAVLTVIAVCLVWLSLGGPALVTPVNAQTAPQSVILAGFTDYTGYIWSFPRPAYVSQTPSGAPTLAALPVRDEKP